MTTHTMDLFARFEADCLPRIADTIGKLQRRVQCRVLPADAPGLPARLRLTGDGPPELRRHPFALDIRL
ncbi:hypothetical protein JJQ59_38390 (plasmid) [Cupriavidus necator]|uniref:hypothetical protein n=1 Tax=Cupriavidus necator TaxID=106590 RepID=UPI001673A233|nr:hypothetical protein [Cupriavidus necator]QQX89396.1 hypothetical protein JJQ59_38390 [Cupriavidus necator]